MLRKLFSTQPIVEKKNYEIIVSKKMVIIRVHRNYYSRDKDTLKSERNYIIYNYIIRLYIFLCFNEIYHKI